MIRHLLAALLLAFLSTLSTGGAWRSGTAASPERDGAVARQVAVASLAAVASPAVAVRPLAHLEDDDDGDGKPDALPVQPGAGALAPGCTPLAGPDRRACAAATARAFAVLARQRRDDLFPTGPPSSGRRTA